MLTKSNFVAIPITLVQRCIEFLSRLSLSISRSSKSQLNIVKTFDMYRPRSAGLSSIKSFLTVNTINNIFPLLVSLLEKYSLFEIKVKSIDSFKDSNLKLQNSLHRLLSYYGSDKSTHHRYHYVLSTIFPDPSKVVSVLEIGLGSTNKNIVSNMGLHGKPGASLRAFKDYFCNARIYGADIDKNILFQEENICTYFVDQLNDETFNTLRQYLPKSVDLIIDDGLHSPDANIRSLIHLLDLLSEDGWLIIEDINLSSKPIWTVVAFILQERWRFTFVDDYDAALVLVRRRKDVESSNDK